MEEFNDLQKKSLSAPPQLGDDCSPQISINLHLVENDREKEQREKEERKPSHLSDNVHLRVSSRYGI